MKAPTWSTHVYQARGRWVAIASTNASTADVYRLEAGGATEREARANLESLLGAYARMLREE